MNKKITYFYLSTKHKLSMTWHRRDTFNFLGKLTLRRMYNALKVVTSFYVSKWTQRPIQWGQPMTISFEPTTACNLRCPECPSGLRSFSRPTGNASPNLYRSVIDQMQHHLLYLIFYFQGEPFIHPRFLEMVKYANSKGIYTITSTNGHFLTDKNAKEIVWSGLDRLIISVDGTTQEVYEQYRKSGNLETVIQGAKRLVHWKEKLDSSTPHIIFQFLVVKPNEYQIDDIYRLAEEVGVDEVKLKTAQIYDYERGNPLIPSQDQYSRYQKLADGTFQPKHVLSAHCWKLWHACVITWNGWVVPCCFDKDATHKLGDLKERTFAQIWRGAEYQSFRRQLLKGRNTIDICTNCTEGCKVWA